MLEFISSPWYLVGAIGIGVLTGGLMTHRDENANEVGVMTLIIALILIITAPYPTQAAWLAYIVLVGAGWVAGVLFLATLSDSLKERGRRRAQTKAATEKKKAEDDETWSAI